MWYSDVPICCAHLSGSFKNHCVLLSILFLSAKTDRTQKRAACSSQSDDTQSDSQLSVANVTWERNEPLWLCNLLKFRSYFHILLTNTEWEVNLKFTFSKLVPPRKRTLVRSGKANPSKQRIVAHGSVKKTCKSLWQIPHFGIQSGKEASRWPKNSSNDSSLVSRTQHCL